MEFLKNDTPTPRFGYSKNNKTLADGSLGKRSSKSSKDFSQYAKSFEKNQKKSKSKSKEKSKRKSKEKSKNKDKSSKDKKNKITSLSLPIEQQYENPLYIFLKKKIQLRNDFDQSHTEKFLSEKELAFQEFEMTEDADHLNN